MEVRRLADLTAPERTMLLDRDTDIEAARADAREIIQRIRRDGDDAVRAFAREFDGVDLDRIDITRTVDSAIDRLDETLVAAIKDAAANIRSFHERQQRTDWRTDFAGRELGRRFRPIRRVGAYVPGGTAAYPSSALMTIIPAVVAGVPDISVATPPAEEIHPATLVAINEAGADTIYAIGGAQAIASLAYGTDTVEPVDKIVGPGNRWVTAAKAEVRGDVDIEFLAGPSEIMIIADETANPSCVAADMIAQAEHDRHASAVTITDDSDVAASVKHEIARQLPERSRTEVIEAALDSGTSGVFIADSIGNACQFAEQFAPEHLSIHAADEETILDRVTSAGSVFLGEYTPVAAGDYASGTNHVLPTGGAARVTGGLSVDTFLRATTVQRLDRAALADIRSTITTLAEAEGFDAHAASVETRFGDY